MNKVPSEIRANILVVNDRPEQLVALAAVLDPLGENLITVRSGEEALRQLLQQEFAVVLLDVHMPGLDGFETAALIRQRGRSRSTPIIFLTAYGQGDKQMERSYSLGAVDFIHTPVVPEILRAKVGVFVQLYKKSEELRLIREAEHQRELEAAHEKLEAQKQAEEQIRSLNRKLEDRVAEVTTVNHELEAFSYSISHDLRAPLRSMRGFAQLLLEDFAGQMPEEALAYAKRIAESSAYMDQLLRDLLEYSRVNRAELSSSVVDLEAVLAEVLDSIQNEIRQCGAQIEVQRPLACVLAHHATVKQLLTNLVANALKFVAPGVVPRVKVWSEQRNGYGTDTQVSDIRSTVRLLVQDNGIGIAPDQHERIFGLFQRGHTAQAYPGTGLGLAIVRKGVERMGGQVGLESCLGQGSCFWFELPGPGAAAQSHSEAA